MDLDTATLLVTLLGYYALTGLLFAGYFVVRGVNRIDPNARAGSRGFRLLILPGTAALWPLLAWRLIRGQSTPPDEANAHRCAARRRGGRP